ncbi:hypothetical protein TNIN_282131 [Trichonephila inaurata madagascariensis]|uniref:Uncharacterized protein n=1 Tax=Trichonephila inaurata madagascariensis TaxID=2747483 RepID=A0A8X6IWF2_9ARAC|nr:hypothetical protein TNIN_282131 [Trichonephila inaurata madagascariensis]
MEEILMGRISVSCSLYKRNQRTPFPKPSHFARLRLDQHGSVENTKKIDPVLDPFFSTDIKPGVNLSCLSQEPGKNAAENDSPKKPPPEKEEEEDKGLFYEFLERTLIHSKDGEEIKRFLDKQFPSVPPGLFPIEGEEKGDIFYDTQGNPVGYKNDFFINRCRVTRDGWMINPDLDPDLFKSSAEASSSHYAMGGEKNTTLRDLDKKESTPAGEIITLDLTFQIILNYF